MTAQVGNAFIKTAVSTFPSKTRVYIWRSVFPAAPVSKSRLVFAKYTPPLQRPHYNAQWIFQVPQPQVNQFSSWSPWWGGGAWVDKNG